jgi:hypothetical protein
VIGIVDSGFGADCHSDPGVESATIMLSMDRSKGLSAGALDMQESAYQAAKLWLQSQFGLERDSFHYLIGLIVLALALLRSRSRFRLAPFGWALGFAAGVGCAMEALDLRDDLATLGAPRWQASLADLARTVAFPVLGLLGAKMLLSVRRRGGPDDGAG